MSKLRPLFGFLLLCSVAALFAAQGSSTSSAWQTLRGNKLLGCIDEKFQQKKGKNEEIAEPNEFAYFL